MDNEGFSGVVRISNVSDFIAPSPACILPYRKAEALKEDGNGRVRIRNKETPKASTRVVISLNDCLACSGCITSAETVLVQEQSLPKLLAGVAESDFAVVTVSPQSLCSIAAKRGLTVQRTARLLSATLRRLGARYVLDSSFARYFSLRLAYEEFRRRPRDRGCILASACPGFVCFAEKTHGKLLIPHISRVRSPQAIMGSIVKDFLAKHTSTSPHKIFHATVMPCFDRKLEASRADFASESCKVDCVISTGEANDLLEGQEDAIDEEVREASCSAWLTAIDDGVVIGAPGGASGGYAEYIVQRFVQDSFGQNDLTVRKTALASSLEKIEVLDGQEVVLSVAKCYGFRNIQNLVLKIKAGKCPYDYVEVMACPSGCANGGGQIRSTTIEERAALLETVIRNYDELAVNTQLENAAWQVENEWSHLNEDYERLLYTDYHVVEKTVLEKNNLVW